MCVVHLAPERWAPIGLRMCTLIAHFTTYQTISQLDMIASCPISIRRPVAKPLGAASISTSAGRRGSRAAVAVRAEISYVMIKPDGVQRGLVGEIITRFEQKGFQLKAMKLYQTPEEVAKEHYKDLASKPFFPDLVDYIVSGPVVSMVWEGEEGIVKSIRKLVGATNPLESEPGTIRGDYAVCVGRNVIHASDSPENGERETALWFGGEGMVDWKSCSEDWVIERR